MKKMLPLTSADKVTIV